MKRLLIASFLFLGIPALGNVEVLPFVGNSQTPVLLGVISGVRGHFVLDLTTPSSWLDAEFAERVARGGIKREKAKFVTRKSHKVQLGQRVFDLRFGIATLSEPSVQGAPTVGILGQDFFQQAVVTINYRRRQVEIHSKRFRLNRENAAGQDLIPLQVTPSAVSVPVIFNSKRRLEGAYQVELSSRKSLLRLQDVKSLAREDLVFHGAVSVPDLSGGGTQEQGLRISLKSVALGPQSLRKDFEGLAVQEKLGVLAVDFWAPFKTTIDLRNKQLALAPAEH